LAGVGASSFGCSTGALAGARGRGVGPDPSWNQPRCHFWLAVPPHSQVWSTASLFGFQSAMSTHLFACGFTRSPAPLSTHCWAGLPLHVAICTAAPLAVEPHATSRHLLFSVRSVPP